MKRKIAFSIGEIVQHKLTFEVGVVTAYTVRDEGVSYEVEWNNRNVQSHTERLLIKPRPRKVIGITDNVYRTEEVDHATQEEE